jgi:hypothetical protein
MAFLKTCERFRSLALRRCIDSGSISPCQKNLSPSQFCDVEALPKELGDEFLKRHE